MIRIATFLCMLFIIHVPASAHDCPNALKIVVGLSAGGGMDTLARMLAQRLTVRTGTPAIVENKAGASGNIAASYVAKAPGDGCTLLLAGNQHTVNPLIYPRAGYESKDFAPIVRAISGPAVLLASSDQPFSTVAALVEHGKAHPGQLSYGSSGVGSPNHVAMELFIKSAGLSIVHVPYKGASQAIQDTVAGQVPLTVASISAAQPFIASDKLKALAVTGPARWSSLPNVPTMTEAGYPAATMVYWMGILAPASTPMQLRDKLNQEFQAILIEPQFRQRMLEQGYEPAGGGIQEFAKFLQEDERVSRKLLQGLKVNVE